MENKLKYSIIYAVIRPEITERISIGIIMSDGEDIDIRYSTEKLNALKYLVDEKEYKFVVDTITSIERHKVVESEVEIEYLSRYSNNLISLSQLQTIDLKPTDFHKDWLFNKYVSA